MVKTVLLLQQGTSLILGQEANIPHGAAMKKNVFYHSVFHRLSTLFSLAFRLLLV